MSYKKFSIIAPACLTTIDKRGAPFIGVARDIQKQVRFVNLKEALETISQSAFIDRGDIEFPTNAQKSVCGHLYLSDNTYLASKNLNALSAAAKYSDAMWFSITPNHHIRLTFCIDNYWLDEYDAHIQDMRLKELDERANELKDNRNSDIQNNDEKLENNISDK